MPRAGRTNAAVATHRADRLEAGHALLVDGAGASDAPRLPSATVRPLSRVAIAVALVVSVEVPMRLFAADALTPDGWKRDVAIEIAADGTIGTVTAGAQGNGAERAAGPLLPGMPNLHSHAFQRAIAGRTGRAGADGDSFWTWRQAMYAFLDRIDADAFEAIAAQAYVEMLKAGYTAVAEFHYVHHDPQGKPYADPAELARRIVAAAAGTGIGLTLLPVFYAHAGFGGTPPAAGQRRFVHTLDAYARLVATLAARCRDGGMESGRRAAQPARRDAGRAGRGRRARAARRADSHPRRRAGAGGRGLRGVERRAADRVAARSRRARRALVRRARDAHDAGRDRPARGERRDRGARADDRGGPG